MDINSNNIDLEKAAIHAYIAKKQKFEKRDEETFQGYFNILSKKFPGLTKGSERWKVNYGKYEFSIGYNHSIGGVYIIGSNDKYLKIRNMADLGEYILEYNKK